MKAKGRDLNALEKDELAVDLFAPYTSYKTAVSRLGKDIPLSETHAEITRDEWYQIATGKGVLLLAALRSKLGDDAFLKLMDEFGRDHAGKAVATDDFRAASEALPNHELKPFFTEWLSKTGLPTIPKSGSWSIDSYEAELDRAVIVYGTLKESDAQREAAERLQRQVERRWSNISLPILADRDATTEALKGRHILLVGRPDTNSVAQDLARSLPVTFGPASFVIRGETYANPLSAVIAAGPNPADPRSEVVVFAGLSAEATWHCVQVVGDRERRAHRGARAPCRRQGPAAGRRAGTGRRCAVGVAPLIEIESGWDRGSGDQRTPCRSRSQRTGRSTRSGVGSG